MMFTRYLFSTISVLFYLLSILLLFNLYFNIQYDWFGVSLIVRVYLFVFSFFMVYTYNTYGTSISEKLLPLYREKYGTKKGENLLVFESRFLPFILIAAVMIIYTFVDYINSPNWPWSPVMRITGGRYSNLLIYSILFNFILSIRRKPVYAIPVFIVLSIVYFLGDRMMYEHFSQGPVTSVYKTCKFVLYFYIFLYDYSGRLVSIIKALARSVVCALLLFGVILGIYVVSYYSSRGYYVRKETGLTLAKMGLPFALTDLKERIVEHKDVSGFSDLFRYGEYYNTIPELSDEAWYSMLFSQKSGSADRVASYMLRTGKTVPYNLLISYIDERCAENDTGIVDSVNLMTLSVSSIQGHETEFMSKMEVSGKLFNIWGIRVIGQSGKLSSVPFLIRYLGSVDETLSQEAYLALRTVTGKDPAQEKRTPINNPEVLYEFKKIYQEMSIKRK